MGRAQQMAARARIPVRAVEAPFAEVLTWSFPGVRPTGGTLAMSWERKQVLVDVEVPSSLTLTLPEEDARPFLGRWSVTSTSGPDSAKTSGFVIYYENGTLKGNFEPRDQYLSDFALIRVAPDMFTIGLYEKGELYEVLRPDLMLTFTRVGGVPRAFEIRGDQDELFGRGSRDAAAARAPK